MDEVLVGSLGGWLGLARLENDLGVCVGGMYVFICVISMGA